MNSVVHFEMPYDDQARMTRFYGQAFGLADQGARRGDGQLCSGNNDRD